MKRLYVRVKDPSTGHEFDVLEDSYLLRNDFVKRVKEKTYPPAAQPRRPKYHLNLAATSRQDVTASAGDETTTSEE